MLPHEELLAHLQSIPGPEPVEVVAGARNYNREYGKWNCYNCGQFKARPSTPCPKCGDDPVGMTNNQYYGTPHDQELARRAFDLDAGWIPPTREQELKGLLREPQRPEMEAHPERGLPPKPEDDWGF